MSGDVFPAVAMDLVEFKEKFFFLVAPGFLVDSGVQMVIPPLATLFSSPFIDVVGLLQFHGYLGPVIESELSHQF